MAYNVLKGLVEGSVDQYGDQQIEGIKVFKSTISASVFYDTDAESPCATIKDVAITKIHGARKNSIVTYNGDGTATANHNLSYSNNTLDVRDITALSITGSAGGISDVPANKFADKIKANFIKYGRGLKDVRGELQVSAGAGIKVADGDVDVNLNLKSGLSIKSNQLFVDPTRANPITAGGQNLSGDDLLLVGDVSRGSLNNTTLANLYDNYIYLRVPKSAGSKNEIQIKNENGFSATPNFTYDIARDHLNVDGTIVADKIISEGALSCAGAVYKNIRATTEVNCTVEDDDYTIVCDTVNNKITVELPPACNNKGRILVIKKSNTDKYNIKSYPVDIITKEGRIDTNDKMVIKMNYASRMLQSDGENWWSIGISGS